MDALPPHSVAVPDRVIDGTISLAREQKSLSQGKRTTVGAVLWRSDGENTQILAKGTNRFPPSVQVTDSRREQFGRYALHAETDAIVQAARYGIPLKGAAITSTLCPCPECMAMLIESGISDIYLDGAQKMRPAYVHDYFPAKRRSLALMDGAGIALHIRGMRRDAQGNPDIRMTEEEAAQPKLPLPPPSLSAGMDEADAEQAFRDSFASTVAAAPSPDPLLLQKHHSNLPVKQGSDDPKDIHPGNKVAWLAAIANTIDRHHLPKRSPKAAHYPPHAAALWGDGLPVPVVFFLSRPPRGDDAPCPSPDDAAARCLPPEMLMVAYAAREGIPLEGKSIYLTHFPDNRGAAMLIGAGIREVVIDGRNLPRDLDQPSADRLWQSYVMLKESGIRLETTSDFPMAEVETLLRGQASPQMRATVRPAADPFRGRG